MTDVFISYSRRDKVFTQKLVDALQAANREVWADWASIPAASDWDAEIKEGIEKTNSVLFVLSPEWIKSNECHKEMVHAVEMGKRLVPILHIMPSDVREVPPELAKLNWVYMRDTEDNFDKAFQTLCDAMDTDLDWIKTHTRIQVRALEWEKKNRSASFALRGEDLTEGEQFIASGAEKNPIPTHLQSEYILASRKDATRRQRQTLVGVTVALVVSVALAVVAFVQRQVALEQAQITLEGKLAAQAEILIDKNFQRALLLGVEAYRINESNKIIDDTQAYGTLLSLVNANPNLVRFLSSDTQSNLVAMSPDGKALASANGGNVILWDSMSGNSRTLYAGKDEGVNNLAISHNGRFVMATICKVHSLPLNCSQSEIILWDIIKNEQKSLPSSGDISNITAIQFSSDDQFIFAGYEDGTVNQWNANTFEPIHKFPGINSVKGIALSPDGNILAVLSIDNKIDQGIACKVALFEINASTVRDFLVPGTCGTGITFNPDSNILAVVTYYNGISLWNITSEEPKPMDPIDTSDNPVVFTTNGKLLGVKESDGTMNVFANWWDWQHANNLTPINLSGNIYNFALSGDGNVIAALDGFGNLLLWKAEPEAINRYASILYPPFLMDAPPINNFSFVSNGSKIISVGNLGTHEWDIYGDVQPSFNQFNSNFSEVIAVSPDGSIFISTENDRTFGIRETVKGNLLRKLQADKSTIANATISYDNKLIATGNCINKNQASECVQGEITLWDVDTGNDVRTLAGIIKNVTSLAFSHDGTMLASSDDDSLSLWNLSKYEQMEQPFSGDVYDIAALVFDPSDRILASISYDQYTDEPIIIVWDVAIRQAIGKPIVGAYLN